MKRINVVGTSASGKSTFSKALAQKLNLSYIELDDLFWLDDWKESADQDFFEKLQQSIDHIEIKTPGRIETPSTSPFLSIAVSVVAVPISITMQGIGYFSFAAINFAQL